MTMNNGSKKEVGESKIKRTKARLFGWASEVTTQLVVGSVQNKGAFDIKRKR